MKNNNRKRKIVFGSIYLLFLIVAGSLVYYFQYYEEDLIDSLPLTVTVKPEEHNQEKIASQLLKQYLQQYQETTTSSQKRITNVSYNEFQLLAGDEYQFAVGVTFEAKLETGKWSAHRSWGKVQKDGTVKGIQWTLRIKQTGENTYMLERIENTSLSIAGLDPLEDRYQKEAGIKVPDQNNMRLSMKS